jgi:hypothetical protein
MWTKMMLHNAGITLQNCMVSQASWPTHSTEKSYPWEAISSSASQEIPWILWNLKVY